MKYKMRYFGYVILSGLLFSMSSCSSDSEGGYIEPKAYVPIELSSGEQAITECQTEFSFKFFKEALKKDERESRHNTVVSPLSAYLCLSMLSNGASPEARAEMLEVLAPGFVDLTQLNDFNKKLLNGLVSIDNSTKLSFANSFWFDKKISVNKDFKSVLKNYYNAPSENIDFSSGSFRNRINSWLSDATKGMLKEAIPNYVKPQCYFIANSLYFKGQWLFEFNESGSRESFFRNWDGSNSKVMMMRQGPEQFDYVEGEGVKVLKIMYGNTAYSIQIILPDNNVTMKRFVEGIDQEKWKQLKDNYSQEWVYLELPRFEMNGDYDIADLLQAMGLDKVFRGGALSNMSSDIPGSVIPVARQSIVLSVSESGTKAAVETSVSGGVTAPPPSTFENPYKFIVDRPFLFVIEEKSTGAILFMGKVDSL